MPSSIEGDNINFKMSDKELKETLKKNGCIGRYKGKIEQAYNRLV